MYILLMEYLLRMQQKYGLLRVVNVYCAIIILRNIMDVIEARSKDVMERWYEFHNEIRFYC